MIKQTLAAVAVSCFVATSALAGNCPLMIQEIDDALASNTTLSADEVAEVKVLRDKGEAEHTAGKHAESVATLQQAKDMLGL